MNFGEQIRGFHIEEVKRRLLQDPISVFRDLEAFSSRDLSISEVEIDGVDSKILYVWKKMGLLPHQVRIKGKRVWGKFSFIEVCWLKLLVELRSVGIGMEKLKDVTNFFHPPDFLEQFFGTGIVIMDLVQPEVAIEIQQSGLVKNGKVQLEERVIDILENIQFSRFSYLIYVTIMLKGNYVLYFDGKKYFDLIDLDEIEADPLKGAIAIKDLFDNQSVVIVNIRKIIAGLSNTHDYFSKKTAFGSKISETAIELLKKQFEENNVEEVTIRSNKDGRPTVYITRQMNFDEMQHNVRELTKKGTFRDIVIKSRDGRLKYFERTEIVKL